MKKKKKLTYLFNFFSQCMSIHLGHGARLSYRCQCSYGFGPVTLAAGSPPLNDSYVEPPLFS